MLGRVSAEAVAVAEAVGVAEELAEAFAEAFAEAEAFSAAGANERALGANGAPLVFQVGPMSQPERAVRLGEMCDEEVFATFRRTGEVGGAEGAALGCAGGAARCSPDPEAEASGPEPRNASTLSHERRAPTLRSTPCTCCSRAGAGRSGIAGRKAFVGEQQWTDVRVVHQEGMFGCDAHELRRRPIPN